MGLFGKSRKEKEAEYLAKINIDQCLQEDFSLVIDDIFTIMGRGTIVTGMVESGICRAGDAAEIQQGGEILNTTIIDVDFRGKDRRPNGMAYRSERVGLLLRGIAKEQLQKGSRVVVKNGGMYHR